MGRVMIDLFCVHRAHDANVIGNVPDTGKDARDFLARLTAFLEVGEWAAGL
jgi:hypothetical protein